jgi:hypothetical protein
MIAMTTLETILGGTRAVDALLLWSEFASEAARDEALVSAYSQGAVAYRTSSFDLIVFAGAQWMDCDAQNGVPLIAVRSGAKRILCGADFSQEALASFADADIVLLRAGKPLALRVLPEQRLELWKLINVSSYAALSALRLPSEVSDSNVQTLKEKTAGKSLREALGDAAPEASQEQRDFLASLSGQGGRSSGGLMSTWRSVWAALINWSGSSRPGSASHADGANQAWPHGSVSSRKGSSGTRSADFDTPAFVPAWLQNLLSIFTGGTQSSSPSRASAQSTSNSASLASKQQLAPDSGPSWWQRLKTKLLQTNALSRYFGARQLAYLQRLQDMFDRGDLQEALRHAPGFVRLSQHFSHLNAGFSPRDNLNLSGANSGSGGKINLPYEVYLHLQNLYRATFAKLDREGKIDEAVFVLAELLETREEALDYLERKERYLQAAELSLRWDMPPANSVRLLMLAGEVERAVLIARRSACFAQAIALLDKRHAKVAGELRSEWAQYLAAQHCWMDAVETIWPVSEQRFRAQAWLPFALQSQGASGGRAWARAASLMPAEVLAQFDDLQARTHAPESAEFRAGLAQGLSDSTSTRTPLHAPMASLLFPQLIRDCKASSNRFTKTQLRKLLTLSDDPFQQADFPDVGLAERGVFDPNTPIHVAAEAGNVQVLDAVRAASGAFLCASGDAGIYIADQQGRVKKHLSIPAQRLIASEHGALCLALMQREEVWRVTRINLDDYSHRDLGSVKLEFFAPTLKGATWSVVQNSQICVLDVSQDLNSLLWHISDIGTVLDVDYSFDKETYLTYDAQQRLALWIYDQLDRRLISREFIKFDDSKPMPVKLAHCMPGYVPTLQPGNQDVWQLQYKILTPNGNAVNIAINLPVRGHVASSRAGAHFVLEYAHSPSNRLAFVPYPHANASLLVEWPGSIAPGTPMGEAERWAFTARTTDKTILVFDGDGRIVYFDVERKQSQHCVVRM